MIRILLADDHQVLLDGFIAILDNVDDIEVVATASNGKQVIDALSDKEVDIALLDINMPVLNGIETCKFITRDYPTVKVIALSMHKKPSFIKRMMQHGASGYILKDDRATDIVLGIRSIAAGQTYYSKRIIDIVMSFGTASPSPLNATVSDREVEVLRLISQGLTNQEIADQLHLSPHTTETHRRHLITKLDARNTAQLVRKGIEKGLI